MRPRVISLFSGAGTFDHGFHLAGWDTVYLCEWDEKARQVLQARFPGVPITNDVREVNGAELPDAECIMFGSPCQDLSVAGKRGGLEGERSGLFMEAIRIIREKREATGGRYPTFALWENVVGAFSSNGGRDFAAVIRAFLHGGARDVSWRCLDAQYFGVPQRRRRIFLVADFGGERAREILFESESLRGHSQPLPERRGQDSEAATRDFVYFRKVSHSQYTSSVLDSTLLARDARDFGDVVAEPFAFDWASSYVHVTQGVSPTLLATTPEGRVGVNDGYRLRRLTPTEYERLQGMPDGWGDVPGIGEKDRYRFMGNGGAAPVLRWIAGRMGAAL